MYRESWVMFFCQTGNERLLEIRFCCGKLGAMPTASVGMASLPEIFRNRNKFGMIVENHGQYEEMTNAAGVLVAQSARYGACRRCDQAWLHHRARQRAVQAEAREVSEASRPSRHLEQCAAKWPSEEASHGLRVEPRDVHPKLRVQLGKGPTLGET